MRDLGRTSTGAWLLLSALFRTALIGCLGAVMVMFGACIGLSCVGMVKAGLLSGRAAWCTVENQRWWLRCEIIGGMGVDIVGDSDNTRPIETNNAPEGKKMNKFTNDAAILSLQHSLAAARANTRQAEDTGCSDQLICELMDAEDVIIDQLLKMGCHRRDC